MSTVKHILESNENNGNVVQKRFKGKSTKTYVKIVRLCRENGHLLRT